jgi:hypothetical protein
VSRFFYAYGKLLPGGKFAGGISDPNGKFIEAVKDTGGGQ